MSLAMTKEELSEYLAVVFPQVNDDFAIDELSSDRITMRLLTADRHLRPGGTVSGPSMVRARTSCLALLAAGQCSFRHGDPWL